MIFTSIREGELYSLLATTTTKIYHEVRQADINLHRLVLLCTTLDTQLLQYQMEASAAKIHIVEEAPPDYELYPDDSDDSIDSTDDDSDDSDDSDSDSDSDDSVDSDDDDSMTEISNYQYLATDNEHSNVYTEEEGREMDLVYRKTPTTLSFNESFDTLAVNTAICAEKEANEVLIVADDEDCISANNFVDCAVKKEEEQLPMKYRLLGKLRRLHLIH